MSASDDEDFVLAMTKKTEMFVVEEVRRIRKDMRRFVEREQKHVNRIRQLESGLAEVTSELKVVKEENARLKTLVESEDAKCSCSETLKNAFAAGLAATAQQNVTTKAIISGRPLATSTPSAVQADKESGNEDAEAAASNDKLFAKKVNLPTGQFKQALKRKLPDK